MNNHEKAERIMEELKRLDSIDSFTMYQELVKLSKPELLSVFAYLVSNGLITRPVVPVIQLAIDYAKERHEG